MRLKVRFASTLCLGASVCLGLAGCRSNSAAAPDADPADINNVQAAEQQGQPQDANGQVPAPQQSAQNPATSAPVQTAPAPRYRDSDQRTYAPDPGYDNQGNNNQGNNDQDYGSDNSYEQGYEQGVAASQPPPPLPDYDQPQCPEPGYLWTPGYWGYAPSGYYWVPGVWSAPPYTGALWTPGWWGFIGAAFRWHQGYWGPHIGYYGGIPYGHGYNGSGFYGGYWDHDQFRYNRTVTNISVVNIRNTYSHTVVNNYVTRVSYNGGNGGLQVRPTPGQLGALREPHLNPLPQQLAIRQQAMQNRQQYASLNGGRPAVLAAAEPLRLARVAASPALVNPGVRGEFAHPVNAPAARPEQARPEANRPAEINRPGEVNRPGEPTRQFGPNRQVEPNRQIQPAQRQPEPTMRPQAAKPEERGPMQPNRNVNPLQVRPQQPQRMQERPEAARPESAARPQSAPRSEPAPRPQPEARPQQARPEAAPQPHPEVRVQPQQRPEPRQEQHQEQHPEQHPEPHRL
jgi:hypothetical protein